MPPLQTCNPMSLGLSVRSCQAPRLFQMVGKFCLAAALTTWNQTQGIYFIQAFAKQEKNTSISNIRIWSRQGAECSAALDRCA